MSTDEWDAVDRLRDLDDRAEAAGTTIEALLLEAERQHRRREHAHRMAEERLQSTRLQQMQRNAEARIAAGTITLVELFPFSALQTMKDNPGQWVLVGVYRSQGTAQNWRDRGCEIRVTRVADLWQVEARRP